MIEPIHIISLGAGVQSSVMALMAAHGEITPMPVGGVFADTGDEPLEVYIWLDKLKNKLPFPIHIVRHVKGSLSKPSNMFRSGHSQIPAFMMTPKGVTIGKRQCTQEFKIRPIQRELKRISKGGPVVQWIGISVDEISRAKDSQVRWIENRHPLLELRMRRHDCERWLKEHGYGEVPKSACVYCPFRSDAQWRRTKRYGGIEWGLVKKVDRALNKRGEFLHPSCLPITQVDFSTEEERGQLNMFNNECEGMCGV